MPRLRRVCAAGLLAAAVGSVACAKPVPRSEIAASQAGLNHALDTARTEEQLTLFTGLAPRICVEAPPASRLCEWQLAKRDAGWAELAATVPTDDRINLLCLLPADGSDRGPDSCAVFPRRSNRSFYPVATGPPRGPKDPRRDDRAEVAARYARETSSDLAGARKLVEIVALLGAAPDACADLGDGTRGCAWIATSRTYGHGILARSLGVGDQTKVRMRCVLPADGSPRAGGSCELEARDRSALR